MMNPVAKVQMEAAAAPAQEPIEQKAVMQDPCEILRTIAHELRQPLSAMESIAYYLNLVLPRGEDHARQQADRLRRLVQQSNWILASALQLADATPLALRPLDLGALITKVLAGRSATEKSRIKLNLAGDLPLVNADQTRMQSMLVSLMNLAPYLSHHPGRPHHAACIRTSPWTDPTSPGAVLLEFLFPPGEAHQEFRALPGVSLCLSGACRIVELHHGTFDVLEGPNQGTRLQIVLP
jgi:signal transduction histidine kinase